jgi:precorrin-2 methylase
MDEQTQTKVTILDEYAKSILAGFCANNSLGDVTAEELVAQAFNLAVLSLRERMRAGQPQPIDIFVVMQKDRYLKTLERASKTASYIGNVREAILYFERERADEAAAMARDIGAPGYVRLAKAETFPNGRVIPLAVEDWKQQAVTCPLEQYRDEEAAPLPEPAKKGHLH